jgi:RNA polymerase sigma-70 factor (ECF subfamily)
MDEQHQRGVAQGLRDGSPEAWRALYDAYAERVWRCAARLMGPGAAAVADVVQETFLAAARSARSYDDARGPLWLWLWGIARNQVALHYRREGRHARLTARDAAGPADPPPDPLEAAELAESVRSALRELPADYETLLTAKYLDAASIDDLAARDGSSPTAVRSKLARAREAFRRAFRQCAPPLADRLAGETTHDPDR